MPAEHPHSGQIVCLATSDFHPISQVMTQKNTTGESLLACAICQCPSSQQQQQKKKKVRKMQKRLVNSRPKAVIPSPFA